MNFYEILGVPVGAAHEDIKAAYRRLAKEWHPDRHADSAKATQRMQAINQAYNTLKDPQKRSQYDFEQHLGFFAKASQAKPSPGAQTPPRGPSAARTSASSRATFRQSQKKSPRHDLTLVSLVGFVMGVVVCGCLLVYWRKR